MQINEPVRALHAAVANDDTEAVRRLLAAHAHLKDHSSSYTISWLHAAASKGSMKSVKYFLNLGFDVNKWDYPGRRGTEMTTPLISAIDNSHIEVVKHLLSNGADANIGRSIISAINVDDEGAALELVKVLLDHGAEVNRVFPWFDDDNITFTPLSWAEAEDKAEIAHYLRSKGGLTAQEVKGLRK
jgi:ankyrin repeat protein